MLTPEQRAARRLGIGSSDIPAIVGVSPHAAPIDVYLDKLGLSEERETTETWCGDRAEEFIASLYEERADIGLAPQISTMIHNGNAWAIATPDRFRDDGGGIVEIKLVGAGMVHLWGDAPPAHVIVQVQWQMEVCDVEHADVAALLGGTDFRIYPVERDRAKGAELLEHGRRFWQEHVLARVPPPHTGTSARRLAQMRYPISMGDMLPATAEDETIRRQIVALRQREAEFADSRARLEAMAMERIGNADGIDGCFTWRRVGKAETWKAAARAMFLRRATEAWETLTSKLGDAEAEMLARETGALALVNDRDVGRRRFIVKRTKEERDGERERRAGALPRAEADRDEADLQGALQAPRGAVSDEW